MSISGAVSARATGLITETPTQSQQAQPAGIVDGTDGNLWFAEKTGNAIGRITSAGVVSEFPLPRQHSTPDHISRGPTATDPNGLWFTEFDGNRIGRIGTDGVITNEFTVPTSHSGPHMVAPGPDGNLWIAEELGGKIAKMTVNGTFLAEYALPNGSDPHWITMGSDNNMWFTNLTPGKIGRIVPSTGAITQFKTPTDNSGPHGISTGPDGKLWFGEHNTNKLGRLDPVGTDAQILQSFAEFVVPSAFPGVNVLVNNTAPGPDGNIWFTEQNGNRLGRSTPSGNIVEFTPPTPQAGPATIVAGPDGQMWFTEINASQIARMSP